MCGFYFVPRARRIHQNLAVMDCGGKKEGKKKRIRVYKSDLIKKLNLKKQTNGL